MSLQGLYLPKCTYFGAKMAFWGLKLPLLGQTSYFFERDQKFWYPHIRKPLRPLGTKVYNFDPKMLILGDKSHFCFWNHNFFQGAYHLTSTPGATTFPLDPPWKKICFRDTARFLGLSSGPSVGSIPISLFVSELEHSHRSRKSIFSANIYLAPLWDPCTYIWYNFM